MVSTLPPTVKIDGLYYVVIFRINSFVLNLFVLYSFVLYSVPFHNTEMAHAVPLQPVVPSWVLAVIVGLCGSYKLYHLSPAVTGSLSYAITFAMYALMITSGLFVHSLFLVECGQAPVSQAYIDLAKLDAGLTSSIAISFLYNGLIDLKILPERAFGTV